MRISNRRKKIKESIFSSRRIFYILLTLFIITVVGRFIALQQLEQTKGVHYLYSFNDLYAKFIINEKGTILKDSKNISLNTKQTPIPPYSLVTLHLGKQNATYQFLPDKKEHTISLFTRPAWYEIIGGEVKTLDGSSIVRLHKNDTPSLLIRNKELTKSLYHAKELEVIALKKGLFYHSANREKIAIPYYEGSLKKLRRSNVWKNFKGVVIEESGVISDHEKIIHLNMGYREMSRLVDKKKKTYALFKATTINISISNKNTPSSTLKLVQSDFHLSQTKLPYHFVNLAHLLIKYQIDNAQKIIINNTLKDGLLQKELLEKIDDFRKFSKSSQFQEYLKNQTKRSLSDKANLNHQLVNAIIDGAYHRAKKMILLGANVNSKTSENQDLLSFVLEKQRRYIPLPTTFNFINNQLIIKGNDSLFNFKSYLTKSHFSTKVPILDKPKIPKKETLKSEALNQFVDVTHLNGLYIDDPDAKVYYSKSTNNFQQEVANNYHKAPPLFLYGKELTGRFVAPNSPTKEKFYYKIVSKNAKVKVAFNGHIKIYQGQELNHNYNSITPFKHLYTIPMNNGSNIIEVKFQEKLMPCGILFSSKQKINTLRYTLDNQEYHPFKIINRGDGYLYQLNTRGGSKTFKRYNISVKADREHQLTFLADNQHYTISKEAKHFKYTPSLSCLAKVEKSDYLSLYDEENMITLIPKEYKERGMRPKEKRDAVIGEKYTIKERNSYEEILNPKLLPIYGDGIRFGLTSHGLSANELTLDANFSNSVADIFIEVIKELKKDKEQQQRKEHNTILEGASVVLADKGAGKLEVIAMFSYPYPSSLDVKKTHSYKKEIFKYLLLDEFNNKKSLIKNRVLDMSIHPGSTFKMVTSMAGFKAGIIPTLDRRFSHFIEARKDLYGAQFKRGTTVGVHLKNFSFSNGETEQTHGANFINSFKFSYNVYFGYLALMLNHKLDKGYKKVLYPIHSSLKEREENFSLMKVAHDLGFNKPISLSTTKNIKVAPSHFPNNFILAKEVSDTGIGQFEVTATPMQMAIVANTIRTRSITYPTIVKGEPSTTIKKEFISPYAQQEIKKAMYQVVNSKSGTAKCAFLHENFYQEIQRYNRHITNPSQRKGIPCYGYRKKFKAVNPNAFNLEDVKVYGKTGTAEKGKGKLYDGWFVAFTNSKKGDILVATVVRNSGTGGTYSATITKRIIESWYHYQENNKNK